MNLLLFFRIQYQMVAAATPIHIENKELYKMILIILHKEMNPRTRQTDVTVSHGIDTETNKPIVLPQDTLTEFKRHFHVVQKGNEYYLNENF